MRGAQFDLCHKYTVIAPLVIATCLLLNHLLYSTVCVVSVPRGDR